jgi:hypothetical protein
MGAALPQARLKVKGQGEALNPISWPKIENYNSKARSYELELTS